MKIELYVFLNTLIHTRILKASAMKKYEILAIDRDGLGTKSLRGNRFYKGHRDIREKVSHHLNKASIP
jgi:hypothetical protein